MSRKKEIVEVNEQAVETIGVEDAFIEDTAQEEEVDGRETSGCRICSRR